MSAGRLGLTKPAAQVLDAVRDFEWTFLADLCEHRDPKLVLQAVAELRRSGLVQVESKGLRRPVVRITPAGRNR